MCVESVFSHWTKIKSHVPLSPDDNLRLYVEDFEAVLPQALAAITLLRLFAIACAELTSDSISSHLVLLTLKFLDQKLQIDNLRATSELDTEKKRFTFLMSFSERQKLVYINSLKQYSLLLSEALKSRYVYSLNFAIFSFTSLLLSFIFRIYFFDDHFLLCATLLPATRLLSERFLTPGQIQERRNKLLQEVLLLFPDTTPPPAPPSSSSDDMWGFWEGATLTIGSSAEDEVDHFLNFMDAAKCRNPEIFWNSHSQTFPRIAMVARKWLCQPTHQIGVERLFSRSGNVVTKRRNRLSPDLVNTIVRSNFNIEQIKKLEGKVSSSQ